MLSKRVLDALREQFHEEFGELSERDSYIKRMKADAFALIGSMTPNDRRLRCEWMTPSTACLSFVPAGLLYRGSDWG